MKEELEKPKDRRVQRTRQLLHAALTALIIEKGYEQITVQNIIDRANLGRSTFYTHFTDKDDLLLSGMAGPIHRLMDGFDLPQTCRCGENVKELRLFTVSSLFKHAAEQSKLFKAILGRHGVELIKQEVQNHLSYHIRENIETCLQDGHERAVPTHVMAAYLAGALLNFLIWWLDQNMPHSPQEMEMMFEEMAMPGIRQLLGDEFAGT